MNGLAVTPTRRRRLEQVERGEMYRDQVAAWHKPTGHKVTAEMDLLEQHQWVRRVPHPKLSGWEVYQLDAAGQTVLRPPPVDDIPVGSVWTDQVHKGRRVRVEHVDELHVSVLVTYSPAGDAWLHTQTTDVIPRGEWTAHRYVPEPEAGAP